MFEGKKSFSDGLKKKEDISHFGYNRDHLNGMFL